ncbi:MAG: histidine kinase dimerization/phospho-acceptor domain-containing protein, partial [Phototrophicales bacterium]|nr:histidine kinase dimerization/phospho-acceptor domain-containing protein [Phototrophicales bacterium]
MAFSSEKLLKTSDWRNAIDALLARLGTAAEASRIYIFQNQPVTPEGMIIVDQKYEWVADGISPEINNPDLQNLSLDTLLPRWKKLLGQGEIVTGIVTNFPASERKILDAQHIISILVFPIFVNDEWWGFMGFDECAGTRTWQSLEIEALRSATNNLGATIQRQESELVVQSQNETLIKANRELAVARRQAEAANKLKSQCFARVPHELRTPLNAVIGYSQLQLAGMVGAMSDEQKGFQERILINAHHLLNLINEVLDISKIEAGRMDLVQRPISLQAVFDEILVQNRILAENKGLALE